MVLIEFSVSLYSLEMNYADPNGYTSNIWDTGEMIFGSVVLVSNLKILLFSNSNSVFGIVVWFIGLVIYWISILIVSQVYVRSYIYLNYNRYNYIRSLYNLLNDFLLSIIYLDRFN